ncbi:MAG: hypothetical protein ACOC8E_06215 [Planctomycetota bacterium]
MTIDYLTVLCPVLRSDPDNPDAKAYGPIQVEKLEGITGVRLV